VRINLWFFIISFLLFCNCLSSFSDEYSKHLIYGSLDFDEPDKGEHTGFLKYDLEIETPYGNMIAAAIGRESGYNFDFSYYENKNISMIWLRKKVSIKIDNLYIIVPAYNESETAMAIRFYDNFVVAFCVASNPLIIAGIEIPAMSRLHFSRSGKLSSFVLFEEWSFRGVKYSRYQQYNIIDNEIIPDP
jgi:type III secretory pathway component EscR